MHSLGVYVKSNLPIARETILEDENESYMCFRLALLHFTTFIFFLYRSPSSSSCSVVEAVSSNIDSTYSPTLQPSWYVGTSMPITPSGFVIPIPLMLQVCFVKSLLWHKTSPILLISLLAFLTVMNISTDY